MKKTFIITFLWFTTVSIMAIPAKRDTISVTQPDGTVITLSLHGDEHFHYTVTDDGKYVKRNKTGFYEKTEIKRQQILRRTSSHIGRPNQASRGLVILVSFKDRKFSNTLADFNDLLNKPGYGYNGATGSVRDYFISASNGQYCPDFDVFGPYTLDKETRYYGGNDRFGNDSHPDQMVVDAMEKLAADKNTDIDFSVYDTDKDGYIDNVFIYYAGYGENNTGADEDYIWPHQWEIYEEYVTGQLTYDNVKLRSYACTSELQGISGFTRCGIGTFCHEFGHVLGLPDMYITDYNSDHKTPGNWDVMDSGSYLNNGNTPPLYSAYERFFLGWLTPTVLNNTGYHTLEDIKTSNIAYMVTSTGNHNLDPVNPSPEEYYLIENRQQTGWDKYLPGHGMLLAKIQYNEYSWTANTVNNNRNKQGYDIIEADGYAPDAEYDNYGYLVNEEYHGKPGDLFPGSENITYYSPYRNYRITEISETDRIISFLFVDNMTMVETETYESGIILVNGNDNNARLENITTGATVRCLDATGHLIWQQYAETDNIHFKKPSGLYLIQIIDNNGSTKTIKGR